MTVETVNEVEIILHHELKGFKVEDLLEDEMVIEQDCE